MAALNVAAKVGAEVLKTTAKVSKEVAKETAKAGNKAVSEQIKEQVKKEVVRKATDLVDRNTEGGDDGASHITGAVRSSAEKKKMNNRANPLGTESFDNGIEPVKGTENADRALSETKKTPTEGSFKKDFIPPYKPEDRQGIPEFKIPFPDLARRLTPRNDGMTKHPTTDIPFVRDEFLDPDTNEIKEGSFPEFDSIFETNLPERLFKASDTAQFAECNKQLQEWVKKNPEKAKEIFTGKQLNVIKNNPVNMKWKNPPGFTWHHNQKPGLMQLVDSEKHAGTAHTGGQKIWGNGNKNETTSTEDKNA